MSENIQDKMKHTMGENIPGKIADLEGKIAALPAGSVGTKNVGGRQYFYLRWTENKKRREKYIPADEVDAVKKQIAERKALEAELKELKRQAPDILRHESDSSAPGFAPQVQAEYEFKTNVRTGAALKSFATNVRPFKKRDCFEKLRDYLYGPQQDKVLILYGLRRTGKTTMIRQILTEMSDSELAKTAFIQITAKDTLSDVNQDLKYLENAGVKYVFFDEVTLMSDFIGGAALFSDVYAASGMKIVLSGTDSLGFVFSEDEQLYDRCIMLHTTFIPYREFERVLGVKGIDEYIRFGGTMSIGGVNYHETATFAGKDAADEYVDSAIARNIQHSLNYYQDGGHFRHLRELSEKGELTGAINRIVEDINHRFALDVLTRDFSSGDLAISRRNLRKGRRHPTDVLDRIDLDMVTERLRKLLEIRNLQEQTVELSEEHVAEIREYLMLLDLIHEVGVFALPSAAKLRERTLITQPGLRYSQADALVSSLMEDKSLNDLSLEERNYVLGRIRSEIMGRMTEDIVLLETALSCPKKQVFPLQFAVGEFDMVVFDPEAASCEIYEVKHSSEIVAEQYRHLVDTEKCAMTEHRYGSIKGKYVLYRGVTQKVDEIQYVNVEEYLKALS